jgi:adenosylhomocysteine nucleosidase
MSDGMSALRPAPQGVEFGFVAALEREVGDVVRGWTGARVGDAERRVYYSTRQPAALICAGTGRERAYTAAKALIEKFSPRVVVSIGFAGACVPELDPGAVVVPARLVEAATGRVYPCALGSGTLVTLDQVAAQAAKQEAFVRFGALAVEMEAAGVAAAAVEYGREFLAIKAISDGVEEDLDFLSSFVKPQGFETGRFVAHIALRPRLWRRVAALNRNSRLASAALAGAVGECSKDWRSFSTEHSSARDASAKDSPAQT